MSYYTPRFHLMVSSRQEEFRHPLSISLGRFPGLPLAFPKAACWQQHSWDKVQPFSRSPAQLLPSLGSTPEFSRAAWTHICQAEGNTHLLLERIISLTARMAPATGSVHRHWVTPLLECPAMLGPYSTLLTFPFSAAQPVHPLHSESFGCSARDSLELHSVLALSPCSVIHAELSSTPPSGNNQGFDLVGMFVCLNVLMYQTLSCLLPNLRWLGISGCF